MKTRIYLAGIFTGLGLLASAQRFERKPVLNEADKLGSAVKSAVFTAVCAGEIHTPSADLKWQPILVNHCVAYEPKIPDQELIEKIKREKTLLKQQTFMAKEAGENGTAATPLIGSNFLGNTNNGRSPLDNSIAISNGGWIVSVANTTIEYDDMSGANFYYNDIVTFFNDNSISNVCDPVILYDSGADRFIFFAQECSGVSANSKLLICFSKTNNPNDGWWKYKVSGNVPNGNNWFDYPKLAISNNELYISGNMFTDNPGGTFTQAILYQIEKANGYTGGSWSYQYWTGISGNPFTLLPVSAGQGGNYGPGCYLVATSSSGASTIKLYDLTDDMSANNEQLNYYSVNTTAYSPAGDSQQLNTSTLLDNGDCRSLSGFYLNGTIHFVFHCDIGSGWNGINYNRLNVSTKTNQSSTFGSSGSYDYSYPSIASFGVDANDRSVMIGFGRTNKNIFPEVRVVNCDNNLTWSSSVLVKASSNYVAFTSTVTERWGDYTGIARKLNSGTPTVWMSGMFGNSNNRWDTWVAEITDKPVGLKENSTETTSAKVYPNPVVETFHLAFTLNEPQTLQVEIRDLSGKVIKELYEGNAHAGDNTFSFNKANLGAGVYFVVVRNNENILKNEKIIINN